MLGYAPSFFSRLSWPLVTAFSVAAMALIILHGPARCDTDLGSGGCPHRCGGSNWFSTTLCGRDTYSWTGEVPVVTDLDPLGASPPPVGSAA